MYNNEELEKTPEKFASLRNRFPGRSDDQLQEAISQLEYNEAVFLRRVYLYNDKVIVMPKDMMTNITVMSKLRGIVESLDQKYQDNKPKFEIEEDKIIEMPCLLQYYKEQCTLKELNIAYYSLNAEHQKILKEEHGDDFLHAEIIKPYDQAKYRIYIDAVLHLNEKLSIILGKKVRKITPSIVLGTAKTPIMKMPFLMNRFEGDFTLEQLNEAYYSLNPKHQAILREEHGKDFSHDKTVTKSSDSDRFRLYNSASNSLVRNLGKITGEKIKKKSMKGGTNSNDNIEIVVGSKDYPRIEMPFLMNMYEGDFTLEQLNEAYYRVNENYQEVLKEEHGEGFTHAKTVKYANRKRYNLYTNASNSLVNKLSEITGQKIKKKVIRNMPTSKTNIEIVIGSEDYPLIEMPFLMDMYEGEFTLEQLNEAYYRLNEKYQAILKEEHGEGFTHGKTVKTTDKERYKRYSNALKVLTANLNNITGQKIERKVIRSRATAKSNIEIVIGSEEYPLIEMPFLMGMYEGEFTLEQLNEAYYRLNEKYQAILKEEHGERFTHDKTVKTADKERYSLYTSASNSLIKKLCKITGQDIAKKVVKKEKKSTPKVEIIIGSEEYPLIEMPFLMGMYEGDFTLDQLNEAYYKLNENYQAILKEEHGEGFTHAKTVKYANRKRYNLYTNASNSLVNKLSEITGQKIKKKVIRNMPTSKTNIEIVIGSEEYPLIEMPFLMGMYEGEFTLEQLNEAYYRLNENYQEILKEEHGDGFTHAKTVLPEAQKRYDRYNRALKTLTKNLSQVTDQKIIKKIIRGTTTSIDNAEIVIGSEEYPLIEMPFLMDMYEGEFTLEQLNKAYYRLNGKYQAILKEEHGDGFTHAKTVKYAQRQRYSLYTSASNSLVKKLSKITGQKIVKKSISSKTTSKANIEIVVGSEEYPLIEMQFLRDMYEGEFTLEQLNEAYYRLNENYQEILKEEHGEGFTHAKTVKPEAQKRYDCYNRALKSLTKNICKITGQKIVKKNIRSIRTSGNNVEVVIGSEEYPLIEMPFLMEMYEGDFTLEQLNEAYYRLNVKYQSILKEEHGEGFTHDKTVKYVQRQRYSLYTSASNSLVKKLGEITGQDITKKVVKKEKQPTPKVEIIIGSEDYPRIEMPFLMNMYEGDFTLDQLNEAYYNLYPCFQKILKEEHGEGFTHDKTVKTTDRKRYTRYSNATYYLTKNLKEITGEKIEKKHSNKNDSPTPETKKPVQNNYPITETKKADKKELIITHSIREFDEWTKDDCDYLKQSLRSSAFFELTKLLPPKESMIIFLSYGAIGKCFTNEAISSFLEIPIAEVNNVVAIGSQLSEMVLNVENMDVSKGLNSPQKIKNQIKRKPKNPKKYV